MGCAGRCCGRLVMAWVRGASPQNRSAVIRLGVTVVPVQCRAPGSQLEVVGGCVEPAWAVTSGAGLSPHPRWLSNECSHGWARAEGWCMSLGSVAAPGGLGRGGICPSMLAKPGTTVHRLGTESATSVTSAVTTSGTGSASARDPLGSPHTAFPPTPSPCSALALVLSGPCLRGKLRHTVCGQGTNRVLAVPAASSLEGHGVRSHSHSKRRDVCSLSVPQNAAILG